MYLYKEDAHQYVRQKKNCAVFLFFFLVLYCFTSFISIPEKFYAGGAQTPVYTNLYLVYSN